MILTHYGCLCNLRLVVAFLFAIVGSPTKSVRLPLRRSTAIDVTGSVMARAHLEAHGDGEFAPSV